MIRIRVTNPLTPLRSTVNPRIAEDPRWSSAQRDAAEAAAEKDPAASVEGMDAKMRPVICARFPGSLHASTYALMRNGSPAKPTKPYAETWRPTKPTRRAR